MKKKIALVLALALCVSLLSGCSAEGDGKETPKGSQESDSAATTPSDTNPTATNPGMTTPTPTPTPEPTPAAEVIVSGKCGESVTWTLDENCTLTISGTGPMEDYIVDGSYSYTPWYEDRDSIIKAVIESGVTSIGMGAFIYCTNLANVTISNSVTSIRDYSFGLCSNLTSVTIPDGVTSIGKDAFARCSSLTSVSIPNSVTSIEEYAFTAVAV